LTVRAPAVSRPEGQRHAHAGSHAATEVALS
jgi:hypothetical protein